MHRLLPLLLLLPACAASRAVAPLEKGQHAVTIDLGGPFVEFAGAPVPVPFTQVGYRYGIDGHTDVHGALHLTGLAMLGTFGFDVGAGRELVTADGARPRLMVDVTTSFFFGDRAPGEPEGGFRLYPELSAALTWDLPHRPAKRPHRIYLGVDNFFQAVPEFDYLFTPYVGTELRAHDLLGVQLEVQWVHPFEDTTFMNPEWIAPGRQGAIGFHIGFDVYLPVRKDRRPPRGGEEG